MAAPGPELRFDRYLPLRAFQGGMGVVELCADMAERRPIALKTFLPELVRDALAREQFVREATIWMQVGAHPHVVTAHMVRRDGERVYVVCEFVAPAEGISGSSLRAWTRAPLHPQRALEFALGIARGMRWACERAPGLVHRDLKPENVLVGNDLRAKVTDFGLASLKGQASGVCGTPAYMPPEQWHGVADVRSDIYAFGLILLELLTGSTGVNGRSMPELALAHQRGAAVEHARAQAQAGRVPPQLAPLLDAALALDPSQRPASWADVEEALLAAWPALVGSAPPELPPPAEATRQQQVLEAWSHNALANALMDLGHLRDALDGLRAVHARARQLGDAALEAAAANNLAQTLIATGDTDAALPLLESSLTIKRALGDRFGEARSLTNRGNALVRKGHAAEALADFERAANSFAELGHARELAAARFNMVFVLGKLGRVDEAIAIACECADRFQSLDDRRGEGVALGSLGQLLRRAGKLEEALQSSERAVQCFKSAADRLGEARELSFQGHTLRVMKRMPDALDRFQASAKLAEELGDQLLLGSACFALAELTPPLPQFSALGRHQAERAATAYRAAGRDDLAADADRLAQRFAGAAG